MLNSKRLLIAKILMNAILFSQIDMTIDTVYYDSQKSKINLSQQFIIESSLIIQGEKYIIIPEYLNLINGYLIVNDTTSSQQLIIKYEYLTKGLPKTVGAKWKDLAYLDKIILPQGSNKSEKESKLKFGNDRIFSSGSVFRNLSISPLSGSEFSGGLQMQLSGELLDGILVNGVLTDQNIPIEPDGTTQNIEDLDNVYINIVHDNFQLNAGDIIYENKNLNRKLVGIKNSFEINDISGTSVYANSKGTFKYLEFKGRDGDQGPYVLIGDSNSKEIMILSGSERVWVNGKELIRGTNRDYIIDYSIGEITFTPKVIIDFDTDISIEYQYSDNIYKKTFLGGEIKKNFGNNFIGFGIYNEDDQDPYNTISTVIIDSLSTNNKGNIKINTAIKDSAGDYLLYDDTFIYQPDMAVDNYNRYDVTFHYDSNGSYIRKITSLGDIYYEYIPDNERGSLTNFYSPYRFLRSPKKHQFGFVDYRYKLNDKINISGNYSASIFDKNKYSNNNLSIGNSYVFSAEMHSINIGDGVLKLKFKNWDRDLNYRSLSRENDILFTRFWNLDSSINNKINETLFETNFISEGSSESMINISKLNYQNYISSKIDLRHKLLVNTLKDSYIRFLSVEGQNSDFSRSELLLQVNNKLYIPYLSILGEIENSSSQFWKTGIGIKLNSKYKKLKAEINYRDDKYEDINMSNKNNSRDAIASIEYENSNPKGIKKSITIQRRLKRDYHNQKDFNYSLFDIKVGTYSNKKPIRWDFQIRKEETFANQVATIYDSVGIGLGQYRFDQSFNSYIPDPNGEYISYNINTGERFLNTNIISSKNLYMNLYELLPVSNIVLRYNSRQDFQGDNPSISNMLFPSINDTGTVKSILFDRIELFFPLYAKSKLWLERNNILNGLDPRGNEHNYHRILGFELNHNLSQSYMIHNQIKFSSFNMDSQLSILRDRSFSGWWNNIEMRYRYNKSIDIDIGFLLGSNSGNQQGRKFDGRAYGLKLLNKILFKSQARFENEVNYVDVLSYGMNDYLPPESFEGYSIGKSLRTSSRFHYYHNRSTSIIFSLNTLNDSRYDNFITMQGEIRAHF